MSTLRNSRNASATCFHSYSGNGTKKKKARNSGSMPQNYDLNVTRQNCNIFLLCSIHPVAGAEERATAPQPVAKLNDVFCIRHKLASLRRLQSHCMYLPLSHYRVKLNINNCSAGNRLFRANSPVCFRIEKKLLRR